MKPTPLAALPALAFGCVCVTACGGSKGTPTSPTATGSTFTITVMRQAGVQSFSPNPANAGGEMVVFRNADTITHRVRLNDLSIDTGDILPGASSRPVRMPASGTNYHCSLHPTMIGSVSGAGGQPPPPCEGPYCDPGGVY
jgi:plastocyanin